jgi:hypothetical protein
MSPTQPSAGSTAPATRPQGGALAPPPTSIKPAVGRVLLPAESESEVPHAPPGKKPGRVDSPTRESGVLPAFDITHSSAGPESGVSRRASVPAIAPLCVTFKAAAFALGCSVDSISREASRGNLLVVGRLTGRRVDVASIHAHYARLVQEATPKTRRARS